MAAAAVLCLAIGIAANATMFNVVDTLLLHPPAGVRDPASLVWIAAERHFATQGFTEYPGVSYPDYVDLTGVRELSGAAVTEHSNAATEEHFKSGHGVGEVSMG
ncbi:MAG: hypothetical protein ACREPM_20935, partial [Gemmatimonadaceae bacterium]